MQNSSHSRHHLVRMQAIAGALALLFVGTGQDADAAAAGIKLANVPLARATVNIAPNLFFILDDSGSMGQQYTPDFVSDIWNSLGKGDYNCFDSGDDTNTRTDLCRPGDPPYMAAAFNTQYYDPRIVYLPGKKADGSEYISMTALATNNWTEVPVDGYSIFKEDHIRNQPGSNKVNLTTGVPDRIWCNTKTISDVSTECRRNSTGYQYPNPQATPDSTSIFQYTPTAGTPSLGGLGVTNKDSASYLFGAPYYYTLTPTEYCKDEELSDCVAAASPSGLYTYPAPVRYCLYVGTNNDFDISKVDFTNCVGKRGLVGKILTTNSAGTAGTTGVYLYPKFLGKVVPAVTAKAAYAKLTLGADPLSVYGDITQISVGSTSNILNGTISSFTTGATAAAAIANSINARNAAGGEKEFIACAGSGTTSPGCNRTPYSTQIASPGSIPANVVVIIPTTTSGSTTPELGIVNNTLPVPVITGSPAFGGSKAQATLTINPTTSNGSPKTSKIGQITIASTPTATNLTSGTLTIADGTSASAAATYIASQMTNPAYTVSVNANVITIVAAAVGSKWNGALTTGAVTAGAPNYASTSIVSNDNVTKRADFWAQPGSNCAITTGMVSLATNISGGATTDDNTTAQNFINNMSLPVGWSAVRSNNAIRVTPPAGSQYNAWYLCVKINAGNVTATSPRQFGNTGFDVQPYTKTDATGGSNPTGTLPVTADAFTGGTDAADAYRTDVGVFSRTDIVPATTSYTKFPDRADCFTTPGICTYAEEITNYANWFSYYRSRMQLMKTATSRAFTSVTDTKRVGFVTINGASYLSINNFTAGTGNQKEKWYTRLLNTGTTSSTPLRSALSKAGRLYAGKLPYGGTAANDDPIQYACQHNFTLLTTDGYWNQDTEAAVQKIDGTQINNQDNDTAVPLPFFDGGVDAYCPSSNTSDCVGNATRDSSHYSTTNSLADVSRYYYNTILRQSTFSNCTSGSTGKDLCSTTAVVERRPRTGLIPGDDNNQHLHMVTFTLGLGQDGFLKYSDDYDKVPLKSDYKKIFGNDGSTGTAGTPTLTWPQVKQDDATAIDDLWHAAVNGYGKYFSARNPTLLARNLKEFLAATDVRTGAGAAAAASNLEPVAGEDYAYIGSFVTSKWIGNIEARAIDANTGNVSASAKWCVEDVPADPMQGIDACSGKLKTQITIGSDTRTIKTFEKNGTRALRNFAWAELSPAEQAYFDPSTLSQWSALTGPQKANSTGERLVQYLRGSWEFDMRTSNDPDKQVFRERVQTLGDIIGSRAVYMKGAYYNYSDAGYPKFITDQKDRSSTLFVGANDGMLHAFNAATGNPNAVPVVADDANLGTERWAYVPSPILRTIKQVANDNYGDVGKHQFTVDGAPLVTDVCISDCGDASLAVWKTILIGGYNAGGRGFYALDVTDPTSPKALWELTNAAAESWNDTSGQNVHPDIGYSFGNPVVGKVGSKWVVAVTSGYNNTPKTTVAGDTGSGIGKLFVLDAYTGKKIAIISTGVGDQDNPSGLARIAGWVAEPRVDHAMQYIYGGDLMGNLWRFNLADNTVKKIAELKDGSNKAQPITARPELAEIGSKRVVYVATGKFLEDDDKANTQQQTIYAIKDTFDEDGTLTTPRSTLKSQTLTQTLDASNHKVRTASNNTVDLLSDRGWYVDLPDTGERVNVDLDILGSGVLLVSSNVPSTESCDAGGYSWINMFDYKTGAKAADYASYHMGGAMAVGQIGFKIKGKLQIRVTLANNPTPIAPGLTMKEGTAANPGSKRLSWRELVKD